MLARLAGSLPGDNDDGVDDQDDDHHLDLSQVIIVMVLMTKMMMDLSQIELEFQRSRLIALLSELGLAVFDNQTERDLTADNLGECNLRLNIISFNIKISISNIVLTADNFSRCNLLI